MKKILGLTLAILVSTSVHAGRSAVKCQGGMIHVNDLKYEVNEKCGEPLQIDRVSGDDDIRIENATYKVRNTIYNIIYRGGKVAKIERA